jgi:hypothetical protein
MKDKEYTFEVVLDGTTIDKAREALSNLGCVDPTFGFCDGRVVLTFTRRSTSANDAVASANRAVRAAGLSIFQTIQTEA